MQPIPQPITSPQHMASRLGRILLLLAIVAPLVWTPPARAATTLTVVSSADSGAGTLREAIASAEPGDTIVFAESLADQAIALGSTLVIDKNLTIGDADAALQVIISGEHAVRILEVRSGVEVALGGLALVKGKVEHGDGGAIWNGGTLTLANCIVNAHYGEVGGAIYNADTGHLTITDSLLGGSQATMQGGAIYNGGTLVLLRSTIDYNVAAVQGGGVVNDSTGTMLVTQSTLDSNFTGGLGGAIVSQGALAIVQSTLSRNGAAHGGALFTAGQATVTNSTFAENAATGEVEVPGDLWFGGGGIANLGDLLLHHVTLAGNTAPEGLAGGLSHVAATLRMANTLIADSSPSADCQVRPVPGAPAGTIDLNVGNLIGDGSCDAPLSGDPLLGPLGDHGGPTQTVFLLPGSPAINAGDEGSRADIDQRGVDRLQGGTLCDIGAVEMRAGRVATMPAGDVTAQAATLRGEAIVPDLAVTTFQYGTTTDYGSTVETSPAMHEANIDAPFSAFLWGLAANTTYHYRAVADTGPVVAYGEDVTFTTATRAPEATTAPAEDVTAEGATLRGAVIAHNSDTMVTFQYGPTTSYGGEIVALPSPVTGLEETAVTAAAAGLEPSATYHYRVVAVSAGGTTYGEDVTFTTGAVPPTMATGAATDVTATGATLHAMANGHGAEAQVWFEYGPTTSYGHTVDGVPGTLSGRVDVAVTAALDGLAPETTYHFRAVAESIGGRVEGADRTFATPALPPDPVHRLVLPLVQR